MILEWKMFLNQFTQKQLLLRGASLLFLLYLMGRQPAYPPPVLSMLICFAATFASLEYMVNVFGLDGWAFYLHHLTPTPVWIRLMRRVSVGLLVQIAWAIPLTTFFYFKTDAVNFRYHLYVLVIVLLQNLVTGCIFSAAFPRAIPKTMEKKVLRVNPGLGLSLSAGLAFLVPTVFPFLFRIAPATSILFYSRVYIGLLLVFAPASAVWSARIVRKGVFTKMQALTTEY